MHDGLDVSTDTGKVGLTMLNVANKIKITPEFLAALERELASIHDTREGHDYTKFPSSFGDGPYSLTEHTWNADGEPIITQTVDGLTYDEAVEIANQLNKYHHDGATGYHVTFDRTIPVELPAEVF